MIIDSSYIYIVNDIDEMLEIVSSSLSKHNTRIIRNIEKDDFLLQQANLVIKEAYIASNERKTIILCGNTFRKEAQNALLKILEEPPRNIVFIILTTSKSSLLPTILSRMPHKFLKKSIKRQKCDLDVLNLDLKTLYSFLKKEQKITKNDAKILVEDVLFQLQKEKILLSSKELEVFSKALKLLELNSRPISIITTLLLTLVQRKIT